MLTIRRNSYGQSVICNLSSVLQISIKLLGLTKFKGVKEGGKGDAKERVHVSRQWLVSKILNVACEQSTLTLPESHR